MAPLYTYWVGAIAELNGYRQQYEATGYSPTDWGLTHRDSKRKTCALGKIDALVLKVELNGLG